jgi:hypothetical protein
MRPGFLSQSLNALKQEAGDIPLTGQGLTG